MLKIALGQMEVTPGRPDLNAAAMLEMIDQARQKGATLIAFPEMAIPGYLLGDTWEQPAFLRECEYQGQRIIAAATDIAVLFGNVAVDWSKKGEDGRPRKYNAFFAAAAGCLHGQDNFPYPYRIKTLQPNYREFDDTRHFYCLRKLAAESNRPVQDFLVPLHLPTSTGRLRIGPLLCEDGWSDDYVVHPAETLCASGPLDLLVNLSSSPFTLGKNNKRHRVFSRQAAANATPLVYVNNVGIQNNGKTIYTFDGSSTLYGATGQVLHASPPFAASLSTVALAADRELPHAPAEDDTGIDWIYRALRFGGERFLKQAGIRQVVIGASGGIDSAVAAALYADIIGPENIILVNMPSRYNSQTTQDLAAQLAQNLGCRYLVAPIQEAVELTIAQLSSLPLQNFSDGTSTHLSITPFVAENIQARDRSSRILAAVAAAVGGAFTCNANKSEMTVGYSTLYGDLGGLLAALGDLWKHQVYALADYLNQQIYGRSVIPQASIDIVPSAELSAEQAVDEGKGDPITYPYHDYLFRSFVEFWNRATPEDILLWYQEGSLEQRLGCRPGLVGQLFPTAAAFIVDLERWWNLYTGMAVAKRIQAPPVLAVSRRAFGFDHREAQNAPFFTSRYQALKQALLKSPI